MQTEVTSGAVSRVASRRSTTLPFGARLRDSVACGARSEAHRRRPGRCEPSPNATLAGKRDPAFSGEFRRTSNSMLLRSASGTFRQNPTLSVSSRQSAKAGTASCTLLFARLFCVQLWTSGSWLDVLRHAHALHRRVRAATCIPRQSQLVHLYVHHLLLFRFACLRIRCNSMSAPVLGF